MASGPARSMQHRDYGLSLATSGDRVARPPVHPGEILTGELEELEMSAAPLARALHVPTNRITQILNGQRAISAETALRLGRWFDMNPAFWLNLQKQYELRLAEQQVGREIAETVLRRPAPPFQDLVDVA